MNVIQVLSDEPENEITLTAFRLLVTDLLALFYVMNEGVINILGKISSMKIYITSLINVKNTSLRCQSLMQKEL